MAVAGIDMEQYLDAEYLQAFRAIPPRVLGGVPGADAIAAIRAGAAARLAGAPPLPATVEVKDYSAPGPAGAPDVRVRVYRRRDALTPPAAFYWIHGGGMVSGSVEASDGYCVRIADELGILVASVDYRLAPEHPYPAPLEDCYAGLLWLVCSTESLGVASSRIGIGGGSAGAGLAAGLALLARDRGEAKICYQHLVYPMLDDRNHTHSSQVVLDGRVWNRDTNRIGWNAYLAGRAGQDGVEPYAAPARADQLAGLPPTYICVGTLDLFMDEDIAYAQALLAAGVVTELHVYPGAFHGAPNMIPGAALSRRWLSDELAALRRALTG